MPVAACAALAIRAPPVQRLQPAWMRFSAGARSAAVPSLPAPAGAVPRMQPGPGGALVALGGVAVVDLAGGVERAGQQMAGELAASGHLLGGDVEGELL